MNRLSCLSDDPEGGCSRSDYCSRCASSMHHRHLLAAPIGSLCWYRVLLSIVKRVANNEKRQDSLSRDRNE